MGAGPAQKWIWVSGSQYTFDDDGAERQDLEPVDDIPAEAYSDECGWWTFDRNTRVRDLAVIYRSGAKNDSGCLPKQGPSDLKYVAIATSDAFRDASEPFSDKFSGHHKCRYVIVAKRDPPIGIAHLRANPVTNDWSALRASFVRSAMPMPQPVWEHLIALDQRTAKAKDRRPAKPARKPPTPQERPERKPRPARQRAYGSEEQATPSALPSRPATSLVADPP